MKHGKTVMYIRKNQVGENVVWCLGFVLNKERTIHGYFKTIEEAKTEAARYEYDELITEQ